MNAEKFASIVRQIVIDAAVDDTVRSLQQPPGRRPAADLAALSKWYLELGPTDQEMVGRALAVSSHAAVFGLFAILDGARRFDDSQPPGKLQLWYERAEERSLLSGDLHDLLSFNQ